MLRKLPYRTLGLAAMVGVMCISVDPRDTLDHILMILAVLLLVPVAYLEMRRRRLNAKRLDDQYGSVIKKVETERRPRRGAS